MMYPFKMSIWLQSIMYSPGTAWKDKFGKRPNGEFQLFFSNYNLKFSFKLELTVINCGNLPNYEIKIHWNIQNLSILEYMLYRR